MTQLTTYIWLPPGGPSTTRVREFFHRAFEEYKWFEPDPQSHRANSRHIDHDVLVARYEESHTILVLSRTELDFLLISPAAPDAPPFVGRLSWHTSSTQAKKTEWRIAHAQQIGALMQLFGSPLAQCAVQADFESKCDRLVPSPEGVGSTLEFTVRDPSEGLPGLFWRNFFGPPFVQMFGDRLAAVPSSQRQDLDDGIVLVQPYELPAQAMTAEGIAREQQLIATLGPECFYDHLCQVKPSRVPVLSLTPR